MIVSPLWLPVSLPCCSQACSFPRAHSLTFQLPWQLSANVEALCQQLKVHIANFEDSKNLFAEKVLGYFSECCIATFVSHALWCFTFCVFMSLVTAAKMLRKKGHTGSLKFDHSSKTLMAKVWQVFGSPVLASGFPLPSVDRCVPICVCVCVCVTYVFFLSPLAS